MPEEESKLAEKLEEKKSAVNFTEEELNQVKEIQAGYLNTQNQFGFLSVAKIRLEEQVQNLVKSEEENKKQFKEIQEKEQKFLDEVRPSSPQRLIRPYSFLLLLFVA